VARLQADDLGRAAIELGASFAVALAVPSLWALGAIGN